ncbi:MAG: glycosyltransferase involved in cell wall biosynthesis [Bacteroidia bacterium]|jgi:glycosyltransferase involved in cell wall biosynthesis
MKVLLINNRYPTPDNPQPGAYVQTMGECMEAAGATVDLLVMNQSWKNGSDKRKKYVQYYLDVLRFKNLGGYDLIYINHYPHVFPVLWFKLAKAKHGLIHWHGSELFPANWKSGILNSVSHYFIPKRFRHITPSNYFAGRVEEKLEIPTSEIMVSPSGGIDTEIFIPTPKLKESSRITLGFSSAIDTGKGADLLVKLVGQIPDIEKELGRSIVLKLIRYGTEKQKYLQVLEKSDCVEVIDPIAKEMMPSFYNSLDVLLFPTRRKAESLGLAALEAMACGIPVVGSNDFGLKEYLDSGVTGEPFETGNADAFITAVKKTLDTITNYNPRPMVLEKYSKQSVVKFYQGMFEEILAKA